MPDAWNAQYFATLLTYLFIYYDMFSMHKVREQHVSAKNTVK